MRVWEFEATPIRQSAESAVTAYRVPAAARRRTHRERCRRMWHAEALVVGWAMFGVASALGVLLGWLIWG